MSGSGPDAATIRAVLVDLALRRGAGTSFCPSEAARALAADWRPPMPAVRAAAAKLQTEGWLVVTRGGAPVDARAPGGPIRLRLAPGGGARTPRA